MEGSENRMRKEGMDENKDGRVHGRRDIKSMKRGRRDERRKKRHPSLLPSFMSVVLLINQQHVSGGSPV